MELLAAGTEIEADRLQLPGAARPTRLRIEQRLADVPHGDSYRGSVGGLPVLVTYVDPALAAQADVRAWLLRNVARAAAVEHRNLLAQYGPVEHEQRLLLVQGNPGGQSARQLVVDRSAKGRNVDPETAQTIVGHVCNALAALHAVMVHGYVNADAVWISTSGRVSLGDPGVGPLLPRTRRFERLRAEGRLASVAPEQLLAPPQLARGSDVFGVATLLIELLTGRAMREAGMPLEELGIFGPPDLMMCLERATAPDVNARPPDVLTFKAELADALGSGAKIDLRAPGRGYTPAMPAAPVLPAGMVMPNLAGARGASPPPLPPPPPPGMHAPVPGAMPPQGMPPGMPPQGMPMMMPPGYPQVGMVVAGPGGVPTVVPVIMGMPMPAAPQPGPPARTPPTVDPEAMRQLEVATRRIAEASSKAAVLELTEDVAESSTRLAAEPHAEASASASLRLQLASFDDAAERLETVDGEAVPEHAEPPASGSGGYFGSFSDSTVDTAIAGAQREKVPGAQRGTVAIDDEDVEQATRTYRLIRDAQDYGELTLTELREQLAAGRLSPMDTLVHPLTQRRLKVADVPELRRELTGRASAPVVPPPTTPVAQRPMMLHTSRSPMGGTLLWIVAAFAVFGGIGVWLWLRAGGG